VEANADWIERAEAHGALPKRPLPLTRDDGWPARRLLRELRHATPCSLLAIEGLALEMLAGAVRPVRTPADKPAWLDLAHDLVRADFDQPLTLSGVAARVGAEPARLSAAFRQRFGRSIGDLVRALRVQFVCDALATDRPLADIAFEAGFADQAHCTRIFKRQMGLTPGAYRAAMRQRRPDDPRRSRLRVSGLAATAR
jgi:AraC-like DNA-binding protein